MRAAVAKVTALSPELQGAVLRLILARTKHDQRIWCAVLGSLVWIALCAVGVVPKPSANHAVEIRLNTSHPPPPRMVARDLWP